METEYIENPWYREENIQLIEDTMIWPILYDKYQRLIDSLRRNGRYIFKIVVVPIAGPLRFYMESGPIVYIYIRGLSFFGGEGIFTAREFWSELLDILHQVPRLHRPSDLVPVKTYVNTSRRFYATKEHPFPDLLPKNEIVITSMTLEVKATHTQTGATITFHTPINTVHDNSWLQDARIKLSRVVQEWDKTTYIEDKHNQ